MASKIQETTEEIEGTSSVRSIDSKNSESQQSQDDEFWLGLATENSTPVKT